MEFDYAADTAFLTLVQKKRLCKAIFFAMIFYGGRAFNALMLSKNAPERGVGFTRPPSDRPSAVSDEGPHNTRSHKRR